MKSGPCYRAIMVTAKMFLDRRLQGGIQMRRPLMDGYCHLQQSFILRALQALYLLGALRAGVRKAKIILLTYVGAQCGKYW